jgi:hypothetical protein
MTDPADPGRADREAEAAKAQEKEGHGAVPNAPAEEAQGKEGELKKALHDLEEEKGDWSKGH